MPESSAHARLVRAIILYAEREYEGLTNLAVQEDAVRPLRGERPPKVEGYVPDVFLTNVPTTMTLIGEAKTQKDLETDHSRQQISAFLSYLSKTPQGVFVLSVPSVAVATARRLVSETSRSFPESTTRTVVLDHQVFTGW